MSFAPEQEKNTKMTKIAVIFKTRNLSYPFSRLNLRGFLKLDNNENIHGKSPHKRVTK